MVVEVVEMAVVAVSFARKTNTSSYYSPLASAIYHIKQHLLHQLVSVERRWKHIWR